MSQQGGAPPPRIAIVVPTIRETGISEFLAAWGAEFREVTVLVVEDNPEPTFDVSRRGIVHVSWQDIQKDLGSLAWIIPRRTDCVRSYGYWRAWRDGAQVIITLDDDCFPDGPGFVEQHLVRLGEGRENAWVSTGDGTLPRGIPYHATERSVQCVLNHGLWTGVPDFDAPTQLLSSRIGGEFVPRDQTIPRGRYFPMCGMNLAWRAALTPAMYFLLMGQGEPYDRFGDIWCGVAAKRICDHLLLGVNSGRPLVRHQRASNVWANLRKEAAGLAVNEEYWQAVDRVHLNGSTVAGCYRELGERLSLTGDYWDRLKRAMCEWAALYE